MESVFRGLDRSLYDGLEVRRTDWGESEMKMLASSNGAVSLLPPA